MCRYRPTPPTFGMTNGRTKSKCASTLYENENENENNTLRYENGLVH